MMSETYNIKWKAFPDHLVGFFKDLGEEGHFADVTLVSDDQIQTPAHKVVLSACLQSGVEGPAGGQFP